MFTLFQLLQFQQRVGYTLTVRINIKKLKKRTYGVKWPGCEADLSRLLARLRICGSIFPHPHASCRFFVTRHHKYFSRQVTSIFQYPHIRIIPTDGVVFCICLRRNSVIIQTFQNVPFPYKTSHHVQ